MKRESVLRMSMVAVPVIIVCGLLVAASSARVDQERRTGHDDGTQRHARTEPFKAITEPPSKA